MDQDQSSKAARVRFAVLDDEDLAVMSAHLQDALAIATDMTFLPQTKRFAATVSRVDWSSLAAGRQERRRAGFHFERVNRVRHIGISRDQDGPPLQLLSVSFHPTSTPAGEVLLTFSGGAFDPSRGRVPRSRDEGPVCALARPGLQAAPARRDRGRRLKHVLTRADAVGPMQQGGYADRA